MPSAYVPVSASSKRKYVPRLDDPGGVRKLLATIIGECRRGEMDPRDGYRISLMCGVLLKAMETTTMADQLAELEASAEAAHPRALRRIA
jgi:hypothetical protein